MFMELGVRFDRTDVLLHVDGHRPFSSEDGPISSPVPTWKPALQVRDKR